MADFFRVWPEVLGPLAEALRCMADTPGLHDQPRPGDLEGPFEFWFDGGAGVRVTGGGSHYAFRDGTKAWISGGPHMGGAAARFRADIVCPNGVRVRLEQEP